MRSKNITLSISVACDAICRFAPDAQPTKIPINANKGSESLIAHQKEDGVHKHSILFLH